MKKILLILLALLTLPLFAACGEQKAQDLTKITVVLDWVPNINHSGLYVAEAQGYFAEQGLAVDIVQPGDNYALQLVAAGQAEFGFSYQEEVTFARDQHIPVMSVAAVIQHNTSCFAAPAAKQVKSVADFAGKKYGGWGGIVEEALLSYERAAQEDPSSIWYCINQIEPLLSLGRLEEALHVSEQAITIEPGNESAWARKGQILRRMDRHAEAVEAYDQAITLSPEYGWAWNGKGLAFSALERYEDALVCFVRATEVAPRDVWFWHNRGEALMQLERWEEAVSIFSRALELDPSHRPSREKRTQARQQLGSSDE